MSRYTTELRFILDNYRSRMGLDEYPIFNESYRSHLNDLIINTFYFDEIGQETPARFCMMFKNKMNLIMPEYNKLYAALDGINPLFNIFVTTDRTTVMDKVLDIWNERKNNTKDTTTLERNLSENQNTTESTDIGKKTEYHETSGGKETTEYNVSDTKNGTGKESPGDEMVKEWGERTKKISGSEKETKTGNDTKTQTGGETKTTNGSTDTSYTGEESEETTRQIGETTNNMTVVSNTPEGFVLTNNIGGNTYASTAQKSEQTVRPSDGFDRNTKSFDGRTDSEKVNMTEKTTLDNKRDTSEYNSTVSKTFDGYQEIESVAANHNDQPSEVNGYSTEKIYGQSKSETEETEKKTGTETTTRTGEKDGDSTEHGYENRTKNVSGLETGSETTTDVLEAIITELAKNTENLNETVNQKEEGYRGTKTVFQLLMEWKNNFVSIDQLILDELSELFMEVID